MSRNESHRVRNLSVLVRIQKPRVTSWRSTLVRFHLKIKLSGPWRRPEPQCKHAERRTHVHLLTKNEKLGRHSSWQTMKSGNLHIELAVSPKLPTVTESEAPALVSWSQATVRQIDFFLTNTYLHERSSTVRLLASLSSACFVILT